MKTNRLQIVPVLGLALALGLFGCSGAASNESTEDTAEETAAADVEQQAEEGIWAITTATYERASLAYERDEAGDIITSTDTIHSEDAEDIVHVDTFAYDANGLLASITSKVDGEDEKTVEYKVETDDDGCILSEEALDEDGGKRIYEYDEHDHLVKMTYSVKGTDTVFAFDEDGYLISLNADDYAETIEYTKNENGVPTSASKVIDSELGHTEEEVTYELDDNGNIVKANFKTTKFVDTDGKEEDVTGLGDAISFEYSYIEKPSISAKLHCQASLARMLVHE